MSQETKGTSQTARPRKPFENAGWSYLKCSQLFYSGWFVN